MPGPGIGTGIAIGYGGALAPSFSPASIAGLQAWYDASSIVAADGSAVTTWADRSGNARDQTQASAGKRPTFQTNGLASGKSSVRFDGVDDGLANAVAFNIGTFTVLVVFKSTDATAGHFIYGASDLALTHIHCQLDCSGGINSDETIRHRPGALATWSAKFGPAAWSSGGGRLCARHEGPGTHALHKLYLSGVEQTMGDYVNANSHNNPGATTTSNLLGLGFNINGDPTVGAGFWTGDIGEFLIYSPVISAPDAAAVEAYLIAKWL